MVYIHQNNGADFKIELNITEISKKARKISAELSIQYHSYGYDYFALYPDIDRARAMWAGCQERTGGTSGSLPWGTFGERGMQAS